MEKGKFITLEGGEGVGKTTNLIFIKQLLEDAGFTVVSTREPGGTVMADKIRQLLLEDSEEPVSKETELLLLFAARSQHINQLIFPALSRGDWVLCDRFTDSTYAYQGGGRKMGVGMIKWLEKRVLKEEKQKEPLKPDLTLLLDSPGIKKSHRGVADVFDSQSKLDRFEAENRAFFERTRKAYENRADKEPQRIKLIDATQSLAKVQTVIRSKIEEFLQNHG